MATKKNTSSPAPRPRSRKKKAGTYGPAKPVYKREKGEADNYSGPANPGHLFTADIRDSMVKIPNPNAKRDQMRWDTTVTGPRLRRDAYHKNAGRKTK